MEKVYTQFPDHHEVATVYAEALFLLEPRRGTRDVADPAVVRLHTILEKVLEEDIQHPVPATSTFTLRNLPKNPN